MTNVRLFYQTISSARHGQARAQEFLKGGGSNFGLLGYFQNKLIGTPVKYSLNRYLALLEWETQVRSQFSTCSG